MKWVEVEPLESIQRLNGIQSLVDECLGVLEETLFNAVFERLQARAEEVAKRCCVCGLGRERERTTVRVRTTRCTLEVAVWRYRCRTCRTNRSPVREWLGLESGATTAGLDRALTALSTQMSFGSAAQQMLEQHGHDVDRTLVERRTYAVGGAAVDDLAERRTKLSDEVMDAVGVRKGAERVLLQVDSGACGSTGASQAQREGQDPGADAGPQAAQGTSPEDQTRGASRVGLATRHGRKQGRRPSCCSPQTP